jgi:hypothetical protein
LTAEGFLSRWLVVYWVFLTPIVATIIAALLALNGSISFTQWFDVLAYSGAFAFSTGVMIVWPTIDIINKHRAKPIKTATKAVQDEWQGPLTDEELSADMSISAIMANGQNYTTALQVANMVHAGSKPIITGSDEAIALTRTYARRILAGTVPGSGF